jgi:hypothetical protein
MATTLHILNGDSTLWSLDKAGIDGERLVWRDVLCEGPVLSDFASPDFWQKRTVFMSEFFGVEPQGFKTKCIDEFDKIKSISRYDKLVLWFEYDLFCQVNMLGILHFLAKPEYQKMKISLICVGSEKGNKKLVALGDIAPENFKSLFEKRAKLNQEDLSFASTVYLAYCNNDPQQLIIKVKDHPKFPYLKGAIAAHFKRFVFKNSGLNEIEMAMLNFLGEGVSEAKDVIMKMLQWQKSTYYGFGDSQYFIYLKRLQPLYDNGFQLNDIGEKVIRGQSSADGLINRNYPLGGVHVSGFEYDENKKVLEAV